MQKTALGKEVRKYSFWNYLDFGSELTGDFFDNGSET